MPWRTLCSFTDLALVWLLYASPTWIVDQDALEDFVQLHGLGLGLAAVRQPNLDCLDPLDKHLMDIA